ncbi:hypothetical protein HMI54_004791 [Coelomomyces lativittatus]|nr:hypothetical protein HMI55_002834 [Coelomomyces lativittatus]KAJ1506803.1 hypothetical protein HMI54_004791 [Coelomomyces lativittatus]KAJ1513639.1 hypothetical protein HMI56_002056 [Coelomomyces lativittatus]
MSKKEIILDTLQRLQNKEHYAQQVYKARAYEKVMLQIQKLPKVNSWDDLKDIKGIGKSIRAKLNEIFETGSLKITEKNPSDPQLNDAQELMQVHGIGPVTARELLQKNIHSIDELKQAIEKDPNLISFQQYIGLKYVSDLKLKIPRAEMESHLNLLKSQIHRISDLFIFEFVGSYRRGATESGDIDVLLTLHPDVPVDKRSILFQKLCQSLKDLGYFQDILALGSKKCMAVCKLTSTLPARRIDLTLTQNEEFPFALLHGTGSDQFQIRIRKHALQRGYTMNERGLEKINDQAESVPKISQEREIFEFLQFPFIDPSQR